MPLFTNASCTDGTELVVVADSLFCWGGIIANVVKGFDEAALVGEHVVLSAGIVSSATEFARQAFLADLVK